MGLAKFVPDSVKSGIVYRAIRGTVQFRSSDRYRHLRQRFRNDQRRIDSYLAGAAEPKLQFGCGLNPRPGWLNTDYFPDDPALIHLDLTRRFPLPSDCAALVFSEHVIEHLTLAGAINMLRESFRVLRPGGRIRVSTPSLAALLDIYQRPDEPLHRAYLDWHAATWLAKAEVVTPAIILNDFARNWGHLLIHDAETLRTLIARAGFIDIRACALQQSDDERLANLENDTRMPAGLLALHTMTFEAVKPVHRVNA